MRTTAAGLGVLVMLILTLVWLWVGGTVELFGGTVVVAAVTLGLMGGRQ